MKLPQPHSSNYNEGKIGYDIPEVRHAEQGSLVGKMVIVLVLRDRRQQQQPGERHGHEAEKDKHSAVWPGARELHLSGQGVIASRGQGCANALGKIRGAIGRMCGLVDAGTPPQLVKRQRRV